MPSTVYFRQHLPLLDATPHAPVVALQTHPLRPPKASSATISSGDEEDAGGETQGTTFWYYKLVDPSEATSSASYNKSIVPQEKGKLQGH